MLSGLKKSILPNIIHEWCISAVNIPKYGPLRESIKILLSISDKFAILQGLLLLLLKQDRAQTRFNINPIQFRVEVERKETRWTLIIIFFFQNFNIYRTCQTWWLYLADFVINNKLSNGYDVNYVSTTNTIQIFSCSRFKSSVKSIEHCHPKFRTWLQMKIFARWLITTTHKYVERRTKHYTIPCKQW